MFNIVIDNEMTGLFLDDGTGIIDDNKMAGFLINGDGIVEVINSLAINCFYVNTHEGPYMKITKRQALFLFDQIKQANAEKEMKR